MSNSLTVCRVGLYGATQGQLPDDHHAVFRHQVSVPLLSEYHSSSPGQASYVLLCPAAPSPTQKPQSRAGSPSPSGLLHSISAALFTPLSKLATSKSSLTHPSCSWQSFIKPCCFVSEMSCTTSLSLPSPPTTE